MLGTGLLSPRASPVVVGSSCGSAVGVAEPDSIDGSLGRAGPTIVLSPPHSARLAECGGFAVPDTNDIVVSESISITLPIHNGSPPSSSSCRIGLGVRVRRGLVVDLRDLSLLLLSDALNSARSGEPGGWAGEHERLRLPRDRRATPRPYVCGAGLRMSMPAVQAQRPGRLLVKRSSRPSPVLLDQCA